MIANQKQQRVVAKLSIQSEMCVQLGLVAHSLSDSANKLGVVPRPLIERGSRCK